MSQDAKLSSRGASTDSEDKALAGTALPSKKQLPTKDKIAMFKSAISNPFRPYDSELLATTFQGELEQFKAIDKTVPAQAFIAACQTTIHMIQNHLPDTPQSLRHTQIRRLLEGVGKAFAETQTNPQYQTDGDKQKKSLVSAYHEILQEIVALAPKRPTKSRARPGRFLLCGFIVTILLAILIVVVGAYCNGNFTYLLSHPSQYLTALRHDFRSVMLYGRRLADPVVITRPKWLPVRILSTVHGTMTVTTVKTVTSATKITVEKSVAVLWKSVNTATR